MGRWRMLLLLLGLVGLLAGLSRSFYHNASDSRESSNGGMSLPPAAGTGTNSPSLASKSEARDERQAAEISRLLAALEEQEDPSLRIRASYDISDKWGKTDPDAAFEWARNLPDEQEQRDSLIIICENLALKDPARAMALAESYTGSKRGDVTLRVVIHWMAADPPAATAWIERLESSEERDRCCLYSSRSLAKKCPAQAASLVLDHISSDVLMELAVLCVLQEWTVQDRKGAEEWVNSFPPGSLRTRAERELKEPPHRTVY